MSHSFGLSIAADVTFSLFLSLISLSLLSLSLHVHGTAEPAEQSASAGPVRLFQPLRFPQLPAPRAFLRRQRGLVLAPVPQLRRHGVVAGGLAPPPPPRLAQRVCATQVALLLGIVGQLFRHLGRGALDRPERGGEEERRVLRARDAEPHHHAAELRLGEDVDDGIALHHDHEEGADDDDEGDGEDEHHDAEPLLRVLRVR
mmetsp:Transcript_17636/g.54698  ORF Transcript_17636/g.54698 Transcript_17636/m.54698 type:complete len:201 (-) Transcript_17636:2519-3121(-)